MSNPTAYHERSLSYVWTYDVTYVTVSPDVGVKLCIDSYGHIPPAGLDGCPQLETLLFSPYACFSIHNAVLSALGFHSFGPQLYFDNPLYSTLQRSKKKKKDENSMQLNLYEF